jgi:hypothetical protein
LLNLDELIRKELERLDDVLFYKAADLLDDMSRRIFIENKDINGNDPKPYSNKPAWFATKDLPRKAGRLSESKKTAYFESGYAQMKKEVGRPPLQLNNNLQQDFNNGLEKSGFLEWVIKVDKASINKIKGNKWLDFFKPNQKEIENFTDV